MFCLLAEFATHHQLREAARAAHRDGYSRVDAYSPFPVEGLAEDLGFTEDRVPWLTFLGGVAGAAATLFIQWWANVVDYPINVGGRPLAAWPAFLFPSFEVGTLWAVLAAAIGMLVMNGLPGGGHPLLRFEAFHLATDDKFFLAILADDPRFDEAATRRFLEDLGAEGIWEVPP
ncbi:MAG: DUF3341 domain-containing protein [Pseudomonadota bacterium]